MSNITVTKEVNPLDALIIIKGTSKKGNDYSILAVDQKSNLRWEEEIQQYFIDQGVRVLDLTKAPSDKL